MNRIRHRIEICKHLAARVRAGFTILGVDAPAREWLTGDRLPGGIWVRQRLLP